MAEVVASFEIGARVPFELDLDGRGSPLFVLSVRKCGSTILNNICHAMARSNGINFVRVGSSLFDANIIARNWKRDPALLEILRPGNVYGDFRDMPNVFIGDARFESGRKIMMVRDPRDALVSEYFSNAFSHPIPEASVDGNEVTRHMENARKMALQNSIDEYVLQKAEYMAWTMMEYAPIVHSSSLKLFKYEDWIFQKADLMRAISTHFGWPINERVIELILEWADVRPDVENPTAFIRKVTPGDHREKLSAATIAKLNEIVRPAMELFDYPIEV